MKYLFRLSIFFIVFAIIGCSKNIHKTRSVNYWEKTDDFSAKIDSIIKTRSPRQFNGVISITQNGKNIYSRSYGFANLEEKKPINLKDNFRIQSNSKQITGVIILREVEKGNIDLHSPISKYLPEFQASWADTVTVHQLLNMSAGILGLETPLLFKPGTGFHYSNPAYALLGRIVRQVTKKEYSEVANDLFKELGMNNTYCYELGKENKGIVNGYQWLGNAYAYVEFSELGFNEDTWKDFIPTGGIISNVTDLHIWDAKLHKGELLKQTSYDILTNSDIPDSFAPLSDERMVYGYGIDIADKPFRYLGHGGSGLGFASIKFYVPHKDLNVIVLENLFHDNIPDRYHFEKEIRKIVLSSNLVK